MPGPANDTRPNIVVIVADDLGYGDLSCFGSDFATPNIDTLAIRGARFTDWYSSSPVCSPSRASLLTGLYPHRTGVTDVLSSRRGVVPGMHSEVKTLADSLRSAGYRTGMVGKWHLGTVKDSWPDQHGFDYWFGFLAGCVDYYSHLYYYDSSPNPEHDLWDNGREIYRNGEYLTELFTDTAASLIRGWHADGDEPFFLYLAYNAPHYPMHFPRKYVDRFRYLPTKRRVMAAMVSALDDGVGEILRELERCNRTENTLIFFMSDNGPSPESRNWLDGQMIPYDGWSTAGLKGHKYMLFEGGTRVPAVMGWPAKIKPGLVVDAPLIAMDLYPTIMHAVGSTAEDTGVDGADILGALLGETDYPERTLCWSYQDQNAVREGRWKLVAMNHGEETWLSDLQDDRNEQKNWLSENGDIATHLGQKLLEWQAASQVPKRPGPS